MTQTGLKNIDELMTKGKQQEALDTLAKLPAAQKAGADYHYARGRVLEAMGEYGEAGDEYEEAVKANAAFRAARFRLGFLADLRGDEDKAIECYEQCVRQWPRDVSALLNLGTLYEERGYIDPEAYDKAIGCYQRVLELNPNHARARLALRDAHAAKTMFYDEEQERRRDKRNQVLEIPVTDFELSVRSRNCLKKMNVRNLGDLIMHTEADLLSYKNFGETSLAEIKEMLTSKGLYLGMGIEQTANKPIPPKPVAPAPSEEPSGSSAINDMLLDTIEFSVRCRKAFQRLNLHTLGDLAQLGESELMSVKNFGQTSLNEVKQKLRRYGLALAD